MHDAHRFLRQTHNARQHLQVGRRQGHHRCLNCNIGSVAHGYRYIGTCQRRGVVDAVACHCHDASAVLHVEDIFFLVVGQHLGLEARSTHFLSHSCGRGVVVASEHIHPQTEPFQRGDCRRGSFLDHVGKHKHREQAVATAEIDSCAAVGVGFYVGILNVAFVCHQLASHPVELSVVVSFHTFSHDCCEFVGIGRRDAAVFERSHKHTGKWMFRLLFGGEHHPEILVGGVG